MNAYEYLTVMLPNETKDKKTRDDAVTRLIAELVLIVNHPITISGERLGEWAMKGGDYDTFVKQLRKDRKLRKWLKSFEMKIMEGADENVKRMS